MHQFRKMCLINAFCGSRVLCKENKIVLSPGLQCVKMRDGRCMEEAEDGRFRRGKGVGGGRVEGGEGVGDGRSRAGGEGGGRRWGGGRELQVQGQRMGEGGWKIQGRRGGRKG